MEIENNNQETDDKIIKLEEFFELQLLIYKLIGLNIVPMKITSFRTKILDKLMKYYFFACIFGLILLILQFVVQLWIDIRNVQVIVRILPNIVLFPYNCCKGILFFVKRKKILELWDKLKISFPTTKADQQTCQLEAHSNWFKLFFKIYVLFYMTSFSSAVLGVLYLVIFKDVRKLTCEIWYPFDYTANNLNLIYSLMWGSWPLTTAAINVIAADFYLFANVFILSIEFGLIGKNIKKFINEGQKENLQEILKRHQELFKISDDIKSLFTFIFFYTFIQGAVSISSCGFQLFAAEYITDTIFSICYTASSVSQVFLYCYFGEKLKTTSEDISNNIFESNWYELKDIEMKKDVLFIAMRSQKACVLSGFGFVTLTIDTFSNVIYEENEIFH